MAQIRERVKKNGKKSFFVRIRMKGKPEATASFERLTDARLWAQHTETAIREGRLRYDSGSTEAHCKRFS